MDAAAALQEARALLERGEHASAAASFRTALAAAAAGPDTRSALALTLLRAAWPQAPDAATEAALLEEAEQRCPQLQREPGYYHLLTRLSFERLSRAAAAASGPGLDALLLRLLGEPLDAGRGALGLGVLVLMLLNAPQLPQPGPAAVLELIGRLDELIARQQLRQPLAVLVSTASDDAAREGAFRELLEQRCQHGVQLCAFHPRNRPMLAAACAAYVAGGTWREHRSGGQLYELVRTVSFADQSLGWQLLAQITEEDSGGGGDPATAQGVLHLRQARRQAGLQQAAQRPRPPRGRPLRIAVCCGGQLRGCTQTLESLSQALGLTGHQVSVFVHSWQHLGRKFPVAVHAARVFSGEFAAAWHQAFSDCHDERQLRQLLQERYPQLLALLHGSATATPAQAAAWLGAEAVVLEDEQEGRFAAADGSPWDNPRKMYYKLQAAHELALGSGQEFDLMIRARPDLCCRGRSLDLHELCALSRSALAVFTPGGLVSSHIDRECLIDDNLAVAIPEVMQVYAHTYADLPQLQRTWDGPAGYLPHVTLEHQLFCGGIEIRDLGVEVSFAEPAPLEAAEIAAALRADCDARPELPTDRLLLRACARDVRRGQRQAGRAARRRDDSARTLR